ncbi:BlaI/MecI/CopY family transcriptional regulator [Candidatus Latescibacterota bacterium]
MQNISRELSSAERSLMKICWDKGQVSARVIFEDSLIEKKRSYHTVKTMLDRMVGKGFLNREKFGPIWLYKPAVSRTKVLAHEIEDFANNVLDNTFTPLFLHLSKKEKLSDEEIDTLKKLIKEQEAKK